MGGGGSRLGSSNGAEGRIDVREGAMGRRMCLSEWEKIREEGSKGSEQQNYGAVDVHLKGKNMQGAVWGE